MVSRQTDNSTMSREEAWDLIPWYIKGTLDEKESRLVEARLAEDPALRTELALQRRLADRVASLEALDAGMERALAATRQRLEDETLSDKQSPAFDFRRTMHRLQEWVRLDLRVILPVGAVAAALTLFVLLPAQQPVEDGAFRTLTTPSAVIDSAQLRVKVAEDVTELELRRLLVTHELQVIDGPSPTGVYTLEVAPDGDPEAIAANLLAAPEIEFATVRRAP